VAARLDEAGAQAGGHARPDVGVEAVADDEDLVQLACGTSHGRVKDVSSPTRRSLVRLAVEALPPEHLDRVADHVLPALGRAAALSADAVPLAAERVHQLAEHRGKHPGTCSQR